MLRVKPLTISGSASLSSQYMFSFLVGSKIQPRSCVITHPKADGLWQQNWNTLLFIWYPVG